MYQPRTVPHPPGTGQATGRDIQHRKALSWPHSGAPAGLHVTSARLPNEGKLPSLDGATG
jgi:hypothetical protein